MIDTKVFCSMLRVNIALLCESVISFLVQGVETENNYFHFKRVFTGKGEDTSGNLRIKKK